jgi:glycosyltransferase involved in cell wall biosynthesis
MMAQVPLMTFSDSIAGHTGLARTHRDIITRIHSDPALSSRFRVGALGIGGPVASSSQFPFFNCSSLRLQGTCPLDLPAVWTDFAGHYGDGKQADSEEDLIARRGQLRKGAMLAFLNLSWSDYLARPQLLPDGHSLKLFLLSSPFQRWLSPPIDGHLPDRTLGHQFIPILTAFDRIVAHSRYGAEVMERTLEKWAGQSAVQTVNSIPHLPMGLDRAVFYPRDRALARQTFFSRVSNGQSSLPLRDDQILACMIGTNTCRKDWGVTFAACAELLQRGVNIFLWGHTDCLTAPPGHWNLPALAKQYGMTTADGKQTRIAITTDRLTDDDIAWAYSAADVMIAVSSEGFGYVPQQSLACGLPTIGTSYAASAEFVPPDLQVAPIAYYLESPFLIQRPIHDPAAIAAKVEQVIANPPDRTRSLLDPSYEWDNLWPRYREWLLKGLA